MDVSRNEFAIVVPEFIVMILCCAVVILILAYMDWIAHKGSSTFGGERECDEMPQWYVEHLILTLQNLYSTSGKRFYDLLILEIFLVFVFLMVFYFFLAIEIDFLVPLVFAILHFPARATCSGGKCKIAKNKGIKKSISIARKKIKNHQKHKNQKYFHLYFCF